MKDEDRYTETDEDELGFFKGMVWGTVLSIPLWLSFFGWINIIKGII